MNAAPAVEGTAVPSHLHKNSIRNTEFSSKNKREKIRGAIIFRKRDYSALREVILHANLVNSNVVRAVRRRGNVNNGANAGPRYVNANNATSNANWNYGSGHYSIVQSFHSDQSLNYSALFFRGSVRNQNTIRLESAW